jgi:hypothetical protein
MEEAKGVSQHLDNEDPTAAKKGESEARCELSTLDRSAM